MAAGWMEPRLPNQDFLERPMQRTTQMQQETLYDLPPYRKPLQSLGFQLAVDATFVSPARGGHAALQGLQQPLCKG